jgi:Fur family transcriptional regulator, ferric uptake regulator
MQAKAENMLRQHHLKVTAFRSEVVDLFLISQFALPIGEIESRLQNYDRITLYRTLKSFEVKGIIHKINDSTNTTKYALCVENCNEHAHADEHIHFHCTTCDNTICLENVTVPQIELPNGFKFSNANMVVNGICNQCG